MSEAEQVKAQELASLCRELPEAELVKAQRMAVLCRELPEGDQDYIKGIMVGLTKAARRYEQKKEEQKQ